MNKVVTINLNGRAYQLEEAGYDALRNYLEQATAELKGNPDKDEIMADFEQAIAEKCDQHLTKNKTVVSANIISTIIADMGPVAAAEKTDSDQTTDEAAKSPRQLYQIKDGAIIAGVCAGIAAYFHIDVTVVRLVFVLLTFITSGFWILVYLLLMLIIPEATTPEQKAAAHGESFNASALLDKARSKYAEVGNKQHWHKVAEENAPALYRLGSAVLQILRFIAGLIAALGSLVLVALTAAWIAALWSIIFSGLVFGYTIDATLPAWLLGVFVTSGFYVVILPILIITVASLRYERHGHRRGNLWWQVSSLAMLAIAIGAFIAIPFSASPQFRNLINNRQGYLNLGHRTVCVGDDTFCHRTPTDPSVKPFQISEPPLPPEPPRPSQPPLL